MVCTDIFNIYDFCGRHKETWKKQCAEEYKYGEHRER
jgi:hypothetical protein